MNITWEMFMFKLYVISKNHLITHVSDNFLLCLSSIVFQGDKISELEEMLMYKDKEMFRRRGVAEGYVLELFQYCSSLPFWTETSIHFKKWTSNGVSATLCWSIYRYKDYVFSWQHARLPLKKKNMLGESFLKLSLKSIFLF